jgi:hypothetical protein
VKTVVIFFHDFYNILNFDKFCRMRSFKFLNSLLIKNIEIDSVFLEFLFQNFLFLKKFKFN